MTIKTGRAARRLAGLIAVSALAVASVLGTATSAHAGAGDGVDGQVNGDSANGKIAVSVSLTGSAVGNGGTTTSGGPSSGAVTTVYTPPACFWDSLDGAYTGASMYQRLQDTPQSWVVGEEANYMPSPADVEAHKNDDGVWYIIAPGPNSSIVGAGHLRLAWDTITGTCMTHMRMAAGPGANGGQAGFLFVPAGSAPPAPQAAPPTPEQLRDAAMAAMTLPVPVLGRNPATTTLVYLPTWFWVPGAAFRTWDITASAGEPVVSATVVAQPQSMVVSSAGGSSGACTPGQATTSWATGGSDAAACTIEFQRPSVGQPGLAFTANGTTSYTTSWTSRVAGAAGPGGPLAPVSRTGQTAVPVAETQALVNSTR